MGAENRELRAVRWRWRDSGACRSSLSSGAGDVQAQLPHTRIYVEYVESYRPGWKSGCVDDGVSTLNSEHCAARQKKFPGRAPLVERVAPVAALLPVLPLPKSVNDNVKHCVSVSLTA